jgi:ubiquinol-cytochrome c reductase core subunit 1
MSYISLNPTTHLIVESQDRQKVDLESVYTSGGSFYESAYHRGRKHLLEHCLVARTKSMDFEAFKDYQFAQNVTVNAATSPRYMWLEMSGHTSNWQEMLEKLCEMTYLPTFDQSILDQEREIVLREISERRGEPGYILYYDTMKAVFSKDSVAAHETLGSSEQVAKTKLSDFAELHQQSLQDSHVVYTLSGGFDPQEAQKTIQTYLETHPEIIPPLSETPPRRPKSTLNTFRYLPFVHPISSRAR